MNPSFWFEYYTEKATKLTREIPLVARAAGAYLSGAEIKERLPRNLQVFLGERPLFLDVVLDNLVNRYRVLETAPIEGRDVYRYRLA